MPDTLTPYGQEQSALEQHVLKMGGLCEAQIADALKALETRDAALAGKVIANDVQIDKVQHEIEDLAIQTIARRAPVPLVLRGIVGAMRVAGDLERIGDLSKNIGKRIIAVETDFGHQRLIKSITRMADMAIEQLNDVLNSFSRHDSALALAVWKRDEEIDHLYTSIFRELLTYMMEDARKISFCTHLLFCAKNIERIGDHCTNIAETVYYITTGTMLPDQRPKSDDTSSTSVLPDDSGVHEQ